MKDDVTKEKKPKAPKEPKAKKDPVKKSDPKQLKKLSKFNKRES